MATAHPLPEDDELAAARAEAEALRAQLEEVTDELERAVQELSEATREAEAFTEAMAVRTAELDVLHDLLEGTLARSDQALVVVDGEMQVRGWSGGAERRFGTASGRAVGRSILSLRCPGLPSGRIGSAVREVLGSGRDADEPGFRCHPVAARGDRVAAVVVFADDASGLGDEALAEAGDDARQPA